MTGKITLRKLRFWVRCPIKLWVADCPCGGLAHRFPDFEIALKSVVGHADWHRRSTIQDNRWGGQG